MPIFTGHLTDDEGHFVDFKIVTADEARARIEQEDAKGFRGMAGTHGLTLHEHGDGQARIDALSGFVDDQEDEKL